jgi:hypothetical protein
MRDTSWLVVKRAVIVVCLLAAAACSTPPDPRRTNFEVKTKDLHAKYDPKTGRLKRVDIDQDKNGRIETFSYWDGTRLDRIEIDRDEDGRIDRWEHYNDNNKLTRIGSSARDDQVEDMWSYPDAQGLLHRVEADLDRDGVLDKREIFEARSGVPDGRVLTKVELEFDATGRPGLRIHYRPDGSFLKSEVLR